MRKININKKSFTAFIILFSMAIVMVIQSCSTEKNLYDPTKKIALENFNDLIKETAKTSEVNEVVQYINKKTKAKSVNSKVNLENTEKKAKSSLKPLLEGSLIFLRSNGVTNNELINQFGSLDSPEIVLASMFIFTIENNKFNESYASSNFTLKNLMTLQTANAENWLGISDHAYSCLSAAIGIGALQSLYQNTMSLAGFTTASAEAMTSAEIFALVKKLGRRFAGWIGVGMMIYEFSNCYNGF